MRFGATAERDASFLAIADRLATLMIDEIIKQVSKRSTIKEPGAIWSIAVTGSSRIEIQVPSDLIAIGLPKKISLVLNPVTSRHAPARDQFRGSYNTFGIGLNVLPEDYAQREGVLRLKLKGGVTKGYFVDESEQDRLVEYLRQVLPSWRSTLVHELIHMLDSLRTKKSRDWFHPPQPEDWDAYVNSPHEFNAFFHQIVSETNRLLSKVSEESIRKATNSFSLFLEYVVVTDAFQVVPTMSEKNQKKIVTRLWQLWDRWRKTVLR